MAQAYQKRKIDLITGFLGAGKTTFLLRYARFLMGQGLRTGVLVYDHGAMNVDLPMLNELRGKQCELETLAGGCDADCRRRRFRTKLIAMAMSGYDRVMIEPSGVFDMDEFYDTLQEEPLDRQYEIGSVIAIVDATLGNNLSEEEEFFLASQAACAGRVLLSKVQKASREEIEQTLIRLRKAEDRIRCERTPEDRLMIKNWDDLRDEDYAALMNCGYRMPEYVKTVAGIRTEFQSLSFLDLSLDGEKLREKVRQLFLDPRYGKIIRVKGFFKEGEQWYRMNATAHGMSTDAVPDTRGAIIVIGSALNEDEINILLTGKVPEHRIL